METPESMKPQLAAWNNGAGIDLESWVGCEGRFSLAVGYAAIFWPEFVEFEGYILRKGFSESSLRGFELQEGTNRKAVESLMNHFHLDGIQTHWLPGHIEGQARVARQSAQRDLRGEAAVAA